MPDIDIHKYAQKIESVKTLVKKSRTSERNKQLIIEFMRYCKTGWGGRKLTDARVIKLIGSIKILSAGCPKTPNYKNIVSSSN